MATPNTLTANSTGDLLPRLSVILCTHNPRPEYLARVLAALSTQSLAADLWELLVVDNHSDPVLPNDAAGKGHIRGRYFREERVGLLYARVTGIRAATGSLLVFVDDDNVFDSDYLQVAAAIGCDHPRLGLWGGQCLPEFENPPPAWTRRHWGALAIREVDRDRWANIRSAHTIPVGAGLCVRREIAAAYADAVDRDTRREGLGRRGNMLLSGEDTDLAWFALDAGWGTGLFAGLKLRHLIPPQRLTLAYLCRLYEGNAYSTVVFEHLHQVRASAPSRSERLFQFYRYLRMPSQDRAIERARRRGRQRALANLNRQESPSSLSTQPSAFRLFP